MKSKKNILFYILILFFILISFPKAYIDEYLVIRKIVNFFKVICGILIILMYFSQVKKNKFSSIIVFHILFVLATFFSTYINHRDLMYFFKVYLVNETTLMCCELMLRSKCKKQIVGFIAKYLNILIIINFITIILKSYLGIKLYRASATYFLGMDNRLILFIIPCLLCYNYLNILDQEKKYDKKIVKIYILGLLSLLITWSVASFFIMVIAGTIYILFSKEKFKFIKNLNAKKILLSVYIGNYLIVICKIHNLFNTFIVNKLHKSTTLSYRTILWDSAIKMIKSTFGNLLLGLGYFDTSKIIPIYLSGSGVNHLHNLLVDVTFSTGLIGLVIYTIILISIASSIEKLKDKKIKFVTRIIFGSILIYLIFESFELYPIYYYTIFLLYGSKYITE